MEPMKRRRAVGMRKGQNGQRGPGRRHSRVWTCDPRRAPRGRRGGRGDRESPTCLPSQTEPSNTPPLQSPTPNASLSVPVASIHLGYGPLSRRWTDGVALEVTPRAVGVVTGPLGATPSVASWHGGGGGAVWYVSGGGGAFPPTTATPLGRSRGRAEECWRRDPKGAQGGGWPRQGEREGVLGAAVCDGGGGWSVEAYGGSEDAGGPGPAVPIDRSAHPTRPHEVRAPRDRTKKNHSGGGGGDHMANHALGLGRSTQGYDKARGPCAPYPSGPGPGGEGAAPREGLRPVPLRLQGGQHRRQPVEDGHPPAAERNRSPHRGGRGELATLGGVGQFLGPRDGCPAVDVHRRPPLLGDGAGGGGVAGARGCREEKKRTVTLEHRAIGGGNRAYWVACAPDVWLAFFPLVCQSTHAIVFPKPFIVVPNQFLGL